jgi:hypothetical protein
VGILTGIPSHIGIFTSISILQTDGSESLSIRLEGVPPGVIPSSSTGRITFIGRGSWNIALDAVPTLQLPPVTHYSGENPYPDLALVAAVQEVDGDQASSDPWDLDFEILPIVDGFAAWNTGKAVAQGAQGGLPLNGALDFTLADDDGSEEAVFVSFDFSNLIEDAGIATRLEQLPGSGTGLVKLVNNYLDGNIQQFDSTSGIVTVAVQDVPDLSLSEDLFLFSNQDFTIPVSVLVRDSATINNALETSEKTESSELSKCVLLVI